MRRNSILMLMAFSLFLMRCNIGEDEVTVADADQINEPKLVEEGILGNKLASIAHGDYRIDFWEFSEGDIGIMTAHPVDVEPVMARDLDKMMQEGKSYPEIYKSLAKNNANQNQLNDLKAAQLRFEEKMANISLTGTSDLSTSTDDFDDSKLVDQSNAKTMACSSDFYNDNYGANWFINNFFNPTTNYNVLRTNLFGSISRSRSNPSYFKASVMAADFEVGVRFWGYHEWYGVLDIYGETLWDLTIPPRWIYTYYNAGADTRKMGASSVGSCSRIHFFAEWN